MIRAFIAIDLPSKIKDKIKQIQAELPEFAGKKTELENLHLTLKFLGEIDEEKIEKVKEKLNEIKTNKFQAEIDEIGVFSEKFVRIVWVHLVGCQEIQKQIDEKLSDIFKPERRFMSHITIARVKKIDDKNSFIDDVKKIKIKPVSFDVDKIYLKKSTLMPEGPVYENLFVLGLD